MRVKEPELNAHKRILWIALLLVTWMIAIIWRLAWLQVVNHDHYTARAARNQEKSIAVTPSRGSILDRNGTELAYSVICDSLYVDLKLLKEASDRQAAARALAQPLGMTEADLQKRMSGDASFVWLKRKLGPDEASAVRKAIVENKLHGVSIQKETQRFYPNETLASHLLGYVDVENKGLAGLELTQEDHLRGKPGEIALTKDAAGRAFERRETPSMDGAQLLTTIDLPLQHKVETLIEEARQMSRAKGASAIVLDPNNGQILALANSPTFDPNERPKTKEDAARHNRAISYPYEPGSIFKMVTYAAALEEGATRLDEKINCGNGEIAIGKRVIHDTHAYGLLTVADAFAKSSNVGAIKLAQRIGKERLHDYILRFGFGSRTGIELPGETRGIVHPLNRWRPDSIGSVAMGQEISVTLLQAAAAMGAIANRGVWMQPHLVKQVVSQDGRILFEAAPQSRQVIKPETAEKMVEILERVVTQGTGRHAVQLSGYTAAGKTGTPQKASENGRGYGAAKYMPSFAGFVPANKPRFVIIVMIDEPIGQYYGSVVAAPVFSLIAEAALGDFAVPPDNQKFRESIAALAKKYQLEKQADAQTEADLASALPISEPPVINEEKKIAAKPISKPAPQPVSRFDNNNQKSKPAKNSAQILGNIAAPGHLLKSTQVKQAQANSKAAAVKTAPLKAAPAKAAPKPIVKQRSSGKVEPTSTRPRRARTNARAQYVAGGRGSQDGCIGQLSVTGP
jgi:cell division protein FtsI (penicillin-binding protein 3)